MRIIRGAALAAAVAALAACGGGGGGASGDGSGVGGGGLELAPTALEFTYVQGGVVPAAQTMGATWTAADAVYLVVRLPPGTPPWLELPSLAGSGTSGAVSIALRVAGLAPGTYTASFIVGIAREDGSLIGYREATVTLAVLPEPRPPAAGTQLRVGAEGVALTSTPGASALSRSIPVGTNDGGPGVWWTAATSAPWLHATAAGAPGDPVVLTADPAGLATAAVHEAVVTVASTDPGLSVSTQTVRVGLWVGVDGPEPVTTVTAAYQDLAVDPVRPYVYLVDHTATITIRNVHTGAIVGTMAAPDAGMLRSPTVSADGARLYAVDGRWVVVFDLAARTLVGRWPGSWPGWLPGGIAWTRIDGLPALLSTSGQVFGPDTGAVLGQLPWSSSSSASLAVSRDGTRACTAAEGSSPSYTRCVALDAAAGPLGPVVLVGAEQLRWNATAGYGTHLALAPDGARLYQAKEALQLAAWDATSAALATVPFAGPTRTSLYAVAVGPDGRVYAGGAAVGGAGVLWAWDAAGNLLWSRDAGPVAYGGLALSGDGLRLVALAGVATYSPEALVAVTLP